MSNWSYWLLFEDGLGGAAGFSIIFTTNGQPNGFEFGTSEISSHNTHWVFGDGTTGDCVATDTLDHSYAQPGTYDVTATCHGVTEHTVVDTRDPAVATLTLDSIDPDVVTIGGPVTLALEGGGFAAPMLVRCWCVSTYMGDWPGVVIDANSALVDIDTTDWPEGTGGIDVVVNEQFSNQLQFQVVA